MEKISKNDKQIPETVKSPLEVRERQNKSKAKMCKEVPNGFASISKSI